MNLGELFRSLVRRWYLVVIVLVLAVGAVTVLAQRVSPTYRTSASVVLVPPPTTVGETANPYLFLGGLEQAVDVLVRSLGSERTSRMIDERAPTGELEVVADLATSAPIVLVEVRASDPASAQRLLEVVLAQVPRSLAAIQAEIDVPKGARIDSMIVPGTERPETEQKARYRTLMAAWVGAVLLGLLVVGATDGLILRRRRRTVQEPVGDTAPSVGGKPGATGVGGAARLHPRERAG